MGLRVMRVEREGWAEESRRVEMKGGCNHRRC